MRFLGFTRTEWALIALIVLILTAMAWPMLSRELRSQKAPRATSQILCPGTGCVCHRFSVS